MKYSLSMPFWIAAALVTSTVSHLPLSHADAPNPYAVGTGTTPLSAPEIGALMEYIQQSKLQLDEAKRQAQGKPIAEAYLILLSAAKQVVLSSNHAEPYRELIMRLLLNQAIELVDGVPTPDGAGQVSPPILGVSVSQTLKMRILSETIDLALQYVVIDQTQIQNAQIDPQAYLRAASQRVSLAMAWARAVLSTPGQLRMHVSILQHWVNTLAGLENTALATNAELILRANAALQIAGTSMGNPAMHPAIRSRVVDVIRAVQAATPVTQAPGQPQTPNQPQVGGPATNLLPSAQFVSILPGTFTMGSPSNEANRGSNERQHTVTLTRGFEMQTTEVTQAQWVAVMGSNPSNFKTSAHCSNSYQSQPVEMCPNHPVENVSYNDVQDFLSRLNSQIQDGYLYRLPTEAEWEYAARASTTTAYSFGDDASLLHAYGWYESNSGQQTHAVAQLRANPWGLYDMHGNVCEWVLDWYGDYSASSVTDPVGPSSGSFRGFRGGGSSTLAKGLRSAKRGNDVPGYRFSNVGLRLVRTRL